MKRNTFVGGRGKSLIDIFEEADYTPSSYSGRGMYGKQCFAITTDKYQSSVDAILDVVSSALESMEPEDVQKLIEMLKNACTESMGLGTVIYWPHIEWEEADQLESEGDL